MKDKKNYTGYTAGTQYRWFHGGKDASEVAAHDCRFTKV